MNSYKIVQRANHHVVYASGFYDLTKALAWIDAYNPQHWDDKTIQAIDLEIIPEGRA